MIFAAGLGTRLMPLTENKPKALVELNGIPLLEIAARKLINSGFDELIINVHHFPDLIKNFLKAKNNFGIEINISDESSHLLDTGGGIKKASWFFGNKDPFIVHNVDIVSALDLKEFYNSHCASGAAATLAVSNRKSSRYFLFDEKKNLCGWKNEKTGETKITRSPSGDLRQLAFCGIHAADPGIFKYFPDDSVFSIVDFYLNVALEESITYFDQSDSLWFDIGTPEKLKTASGELSNRKL